MDSNQADNLFILQEELRNSFQALEDVQLQLHAVLIHPSPHDEQYLITAEYATIAYLDKLREVMKARGVRPTERDYHSADRHHQRHY